MKNIVLIFAVAALSLVCSNCKKTVTGADLPTDYYLYTAFNSGGAAVVRGTVILSRTDSTGLVGSWNLQMVGMNQSVGPQVGLGALQGTVSGDDVYIALNPLMADNNVNLTGTYTDTGFRDITGTWEWTTLAAVAARGTFTLIHM